MTIAYVGVMRFISLRPSRQQPAPMKVAHRTNKRGRLRAPVDATFRQVSLICRLNRAAKSFGIGSRYASMEQASGACWR